MENGQLSSDPAHSGSINKSGEKTFHRHETLLKPLSQVESRQWAKTWPLHRELFFLGILNRLRSSQDIGKTSPFRQSAGGTIRNGLHAKKRKGGEERRRIATSWVVSWAFTNYYRYIDNVDLTSGHTWKGQETEIKPSCANLTQFHYKAPLANT